MLQAGPKQQASRGTRKKRVTYLNSSCVIYFNHFQVTVTLFIPEKTNALLPILNKITSDLKCTGYTSYLSLITIKCETSSGNKEILCYLGVL